MDAPKIDADLLKLVLVLVILIFVASQFKKILKSLGIGKDPNAEKGAKDFVSQLKYDPKKVSYPVATITNMANKLYDAMKGAGTNDSAIKTVFNLFKNQDDLYAVMHYFGVRDGESMPQYIQSDINQVNPFGLSINDLNEILAKKKINFRF